MSSLYNKNIVVGVTGGIAAYKSAELVRRLQDAGATVRVVMTKSACEFITPMTMQALSGHPVHLDLLNTEAEAAMGHIELARWGDALIIAPATADFIAKIVQGAGSDLLSTLCLASQAPLLVAPAMNQAMWAAQVTQDNIRILESRAVRIIGPGYGVQACGDIGAGRMEEANAIVAATKSLFQNGLLAGKRVTITAGPTREAIDPVRYISNHSSGKMGYALAAACVEAGALVSMISGPVTLPIPEHVECIDVISAQEMFEASLESAKSADVFIACAAVADYRVENTQATKIKKTDSSPLNLKLVQNPDIIAAVAQCRPKPFVVGFAAETENLETYAKAKLAKKGMDMIVANDVSNARIGFNSDDNAVDAYGPDWHKSVKIQNKNAIARELVLLIAKYLEA